MFLAGLDVVGDKIMEINVFSPGGLGSARKLEGVDFAGAVIERLETRSRIARCAGKADQLELAMM